MKPKIKQTTNKFMPTKFYKDRVRQGKLLNNQSSETGLLSHDLVGNPLVGGEVGGRGRGSVVTSAGLGCNSRGWGWVKEVVVALSLSLITPSDWQEPLLIFRLLAWGNNCNSARDCARPQEVSSEPGSGAGCCGVACLAFVVWGCRKCPCYVWNV